MADIQTKSEDNTQIPSIAAEAVLAKCAPMPKDAEEVKGYDFSQKQFKLSDFLSSFKTTGFQATHLGRASDEINQMIALRNSDKKCRIFLGFTSNMISSGVRETIKFLVQNNMVDVIVTTAGGVEEDLIKCLAPHYIGNFGLAGKLLRKKGHNRIGNLLVPNDNYCKFEKWFVPILQKMHEEQDKDGVVWTPSKMIHRLGKEINDPSSVCYWAYKNQIPIFSPALTDGSIGDMIFFQNYNKEGFILDIVGDIRRINDLALHATNTGMIIVGGGLIKHHICNANLMRNGADFSVYINTAQEFDGSDSGASPDEAVSWGKIKDTAEPVKVSGEATVIFPLLVAMTFAKDKTENN